MSVQYKTVGIKPEAVGIKPEAVGINNESTVTELKSTGFFQNSIGLNKKRTMQVLNPNQVTTKSQRVRINIMEKQ